MEKQRLVAARLVLSQRWPRQVAAYESGNKLPHSIKIPRNLRPDPFSHRHRDAISDHSVGIVTTPHKSECVRDSLQPGIFSHRVRPRAMRKNRIRQLATILHAVAKILHGALTHAKLR